MKRVLRVCLGVGLGLVILAGCGESGGTQLDELAADQTPRDTLHPPTTLASEVRQSASDPREGVSEAPELSSTVPHTSRDAISGTVEAPDGTWRFTLQTDGSYYLEGTLRGESLVSTYNAETGERIVIADRPNEPTYAYKVVGLPPTSFVDSSHGLLESALLMDTRSWIRTVGNAPGDETFGSLSGSMREDYEIPGRFDQAFPPSDIRPPPLTWTTTDVAEYTGEPVSEIAAAIEFEGMKVTDWGFRRIEPEEAQGLVDYQIPFLEPTLPDGFTLASVYYADASAVPAQAGNPPSEQVIVATYRRGFDNVTLTYRSALQNSAQEAAVQSEWDDPHSDLGGPARFTFDLIAGEARVGVGVPLYTWNASDDVVAIVSTSANLGTLQQAVTEINQ